MDGNSLERKRYAAYPEYMDSGVEWLGDVPKDWSVIPVKYLAELTPKKSAIDPSVMDKECSFLPMEKLKLNSITLDETRKISDVYDGYTYFENGDVLIAKVTPCFENKNMAVAAGLTNGIGFGSSEIYVLRSNGRVNNRFLYYRLQEDSFMDIATAAMTGAGGLKRVPGEVVNTYSFATPEYAEQTHIANFLDHETAKIDTLIEEQQSLIRLLKEKRQAVISHAVTKGLNPDAPMKDSGVEWLGEVPEHWKVVSLKHLVSTPIIDGPHESPTRQDEGVPFISAEAISGGTINFDKKWGYISAENHERYSKRYSPQYGDILMVKLGATTGRVALVTTDEMFNIWVPLAIVRTKAAALSKFVFYLFQSSEVQDAIQLSWTYGTQQTLGLKTLGNLSVPAPSDEEAVAIVEHIESIISAFDLSLQESQHSIELLQERRTALISAVVTGKIDVRDWQPEAQQQEQPTEATA
ncbi:restriction endonuclease subunit S [Endozoicomonas sp. ISHI1]|uniref:restriction endonuclease subunit S n=1 Tax=Endozoicomonas sp. ISHI1 TaxID=2825882 RepID=UPI00214932FF|nr:restriction endonuclease subunit S [Endozoicomonas sp. ISHI1]